MNRHYWMKTWTAVAALTILCVIMQGCGGGGGGVSTVSGTVSDINRNTIIGATVTADGIHAESLASGVFRINGVKSGWKTFRASVVVDGHTWVGTQAVEVLKDEPTMNANIVVVPLSDTIDISGVVRDDTVTRVAGARVLLTTRTLYPGANTSAYDGPYSSMVAITNANGEYLLEDVPAGVDVTLTASKVGFRNSEEEFTTDTSSMSQNFDLVKSNLSGSPGDPFLDAVEAYTMPNVLTRSTDTGAYRAIKAFTSERFRKSLGGKQTTTTRAAPAGSLIEVDLYWNALDIANDSRDLAGYGIYRATGLTASLASIDFVRDPYANFYGDTGAEISAYTNYRYAVSTVDVEFLDANNNPDPNAESQISNVLTIAPLGQLRLTSPAQAVNLTSDPTFVWTPLQDAESYTVYLYETYPTLPLDPSYDYGADPILGVGAMPVWPRQASPDESTVGAGASSIAYTGLALESGHTYYWVVLASKVYERYDDNSLMRSAYSYSQIRSFVR